MAVKEIIRLARGNLTQPMFVDFLREKWGIKTSQGLISKYESGKINPPTRIIDSCMEIIHAKNIPDNTKPEELESRIRMVLTGPDQVKARKVFEVILESLF